MLAKEHKQFLLAILISGVAAGLILIPAVTYGPYKNNAYKEFSKYFTCPKGERSYQTFTANVSLSFPLANYAQAQPANKASTLWRFPGVLRRLEITQNDDERKQLLVLLAESRADVIKDFTQAYPQLVFVDAREIKPYFGNVKFSYIDYFLKDAKFRSLWQEYSKVGQFHGFDIYRRHGCNKPLN